MDRDLQLKRRTFVKHPLVSGADVPPSIPLAVPSNLCYDQRTNTIHKPGPKTTSNESFSNGPPVYLIPRALEMLQRIKKPIAVLSICGPYRSGKSYILSRILGVPNAFGVGDTMKQCTHGVWLATTALECDDFIVVFLDTEGTDHAGATEADLRCNFSLLVFTVLISSTLIYNSMRVPRKSDLEAMSFFAQLSSMIRNSQKQNMEFDFHQQFPKFQWLFRDVMLPPVNDDGNEIPITDYVKTQVLSEEASSSPQVQGVVNALLQLFPSFECHMLPIPATKRDVLKSITKNESKLSAEFNDDVAQLSRYLLNDIEPKKSITSGDQQLMNGSLLSILIEECLESLNTSNVIPELRFGWQAAMDNRLEALLNKLVNEYQEQLEEALRDRGAIEESVPSNFEISNTRRSSPQSGSEIEVLETDVPSRSRKLSIASSVLSPIQVTPPRTLIGIHQSILDSKLREFRHEINRCMGAISEERKAELLLRLENRIVKYDKTSDGNCTGRVVGGILLKYVQENYDKSKERCSQTFDHIVEPLKENLTRVVDGLSDEYFSMAVGPAKNDVFTLKMGEFKELTSQLAPGSPRNLRVVGHAKNKLKIRWKRPELHPRAVTGYEVQIMERVKQQRRGEWRTIISSTVKRAAIVTDLRPSTTYLFRVRGRNTNQIGEWSEEIEATTRMGQAGRYGASAAGFVGGSITAPFVLTAETFKEGWQICRESETCAEKVQASVGMVVGGLMTPIIVLSESLLTTSTGLECAETVYENTGVTEEDDLDETRAEVVSIAPVQSEASSSHSSSGSNSNPDSNSSPSTGSNPPFEQQQTAIVETDGAAAESMQNVVGGGESYKHYSLSVRRECSPSDETNTDDYANIIETMKKPSVDISASGDPSSQLSVGDHSSFEGSAMVHPVISSLQYDSQGSAENNDSFSIFHSFAFNEQQS